MAPQGLGPNAVNNPLTRYLLTSNYYTLSPSNRKLPGALSSLNV